MFLLARYNHQVPENFTDLRRNYFNLNLEFMTIHGSKDLEADHVILLEASAGQWGFPSEIVDDPLLNIVLPESEEVSHAEERRLFYVAMTRARFSLTLLADQINPSAFVRGLESSTYDTVVLNNAVVAKKSCGKCGGRLFLREKRSGTFLNVRTITIVVKNSNLANNAIKTYQFWTR